jgi:protoporphyrinogen oxidase
MRDVVIIGGGLSGLAAALELEGLKIPYRLIEVEKRLGGSIITEQRDGFVLDGGPFAFPAYEDFSFLSELGLEDALSPVHDGRDRNAWESAGGHTRRWQAFKGGTQMLIDVLAGKVNPTVMYKMAVSSIGTLNGRFTICLENGLMLDTAAVIVAAPARYAERMFRTLQPDISQRLLDYGYDTITRIALGYRSEALHLPPSLPWDMAVAFYWWTDDSHRVPSGHVLLHVGLRTPAQLAASDTLITAVHDQIKAQGQPLVARVSYWPEADPLPPHTPGFTEKMTALQTLLPPGVALVGSDYNGISLASRMAAGREAARSIARWLDSK